MPQMVITCTDCGTRLKVRPGLVGKAVRCRKCKAKLLVVDPARVSSSDDSPDDCPAEPPPRSRGARPRRKRRPLALIAVPAIVIAGAVLYTQHYHGPSGRTSDPARRAEAPPSPAPATASATSAAPDAPAVETRRRDTDPPSRNPPTSIRAPEDLEGLNREVARLIGPGAPDRRDVAWVERMPRLPEPLVMRDWPEVARKYYRTILDKDRTVEDRPFFVVKPRKCEPVPVPSRYVRTEGGKPGWKAEYFGNGKFEGAPVLVRTDREVDFGWGMGSPAPEVKADRFSARWSGRLAPEETATYRFTVDADDGARVTVDGRTVFDHLGGVFGGSASLDLRKGRTYEVVVEYVERSGEARMRLHWDYLPPGSRERDMVDYSMRSYMTSDPGHEAFTCLSAVVGARLMGLDLRKAAGFDYVNASKAWYDPGTGLYRHSPGGQTPVVHSGIYGYWSSVYGLILAAQYPDDADFARHARTTTQAFLKIARGMGCPQAPDFRAPGFNFKTGLPEGRREPMNRVGHAPIVAWALMVGHGLTGSPEMLECARSTIEWYVENPGRYEATHLMGPLVAARLNAEHGDAVELARVMAAWFGDGDKKTHPWHVTAGARFGGVTCDGVDGARWDAKQRSFHGFSLGTLKGPSWLVPVARYDQRYARSIARYALHAASSARLFQGYKLDWDHQDHKDWKDRWDPECLFFYEALQPWEPSDERKFRPYATGDPVKNGWGCPKAGPREYLAKKKEWFSRAANNLSLYMGNHVGFLGAICERTEAPGILRWDCTATDWFGPRAYPTYLYYNPHAEPKTVAVKVSAPADLYDTAAGRFVATGVTAEHAVTIEPDRAMVLVAVPSGGRITCGERGLAVDGVVIDYRARRR